jgi:chromosome segregation ATPase
MYTLNDEFQTLKNSGGTNTIALAHQLSQLSDTVKDNSNKIDSNTQTTGKNVQSIQSNVKAIKSNDDNFKTVTDGLAAAVKSVNDNKVQAEGEIGLLTKGLSNKADQKEVDANQAAIVDVFTNLTSINSTIAATSASFTNLISANTKQAATNNQSITDALTAVSSTLASTTTAVVKNSGTLATQHNTLLGLSTQLVEITAEFNACKACDKPNSSTSSPVWGRLVK